jgi:hypothetical protein
VERIVRFRVTPARPAGPMVRFEANAIGKEGAWTPKHTKRPQTAQLSMSRLLRRGLCARLGRHAPGAVTALEAERTELDRERHRLLYVATTRARDLPLLPVLSCGAPSFSWAASLALGAETLEAFDADGLGEARHEREDEAANMQDRPRFVTEAALIGEHTRRIKRVTPHLVEAGDVIPASEERHHSGSARRTTCRPYPAAAWLGASCCTSCWKRC